METNIPTAAPRLLHLGCGLTAPPNWVNVDGSWNAWLAHHPLLQRTLFGLRLARPSPSGAWPKNIIHHDLRRPLPFRDGWFDGVFSSHTLEHLFRGQALGLLRECRRVLKPGALYRTRADHHAHKWMYDGPSLCRLMTEAGFADCREMGFLRSQIPLLDQVEFAGRITDGQGVAVEGHRPT